MTKIIRSHLGKCGFPLSYTIIRWLCLFGCLCLWEFVCMKILNMEIIASVPFHSTSQTFYSENVDLIIPDLDLCLFLSTKTSTYPSIHPCVVVFNLWGSRLELERIPADIGAEGKVHPGEVTSVTSQTNLHLSSDCGRKNGENPHSWTSPNHQRMENLPHLTQKHEPWLLLWSDCVWWKPTAPMLARL